MTKKWRSPHDVAGKEQQIKSTALYIAITFTILAFIAQLAGSYYTGSIALLSDTAHLFTDSFSLGLSLFAVKLTGRAPSPTQTYGLYRSEVLATFLNGLLLLFVAAGIAWEACNRFFTPQPVLALPLVVVATVGLLFNLVSAFFLHRAMGESAHEHHGHTHEHSHEHEELQQHEDRNLKGALLHVISDAAGSVAVILGAVIIYYTEYYWVDALVGLLLSLVIAYWSWKLLRDTTHVLLESTPPHVNVPHLLEELKGLDKRILSVDDLHIWEITSRMYSLTADVKVQEMNLAEADHIRKALEIFLRQHYGIAHPTISMKCS